MHRSTALSAPRLAAAVMLVAWLSSSSVSMAGDDPPRRAAVVPAGPACQKTSGGEVSQTQYGGAPEQPMPYGNGIAPPQAYFIPPPAPLPPRYFPNGALDSSTTARPDWQPWKDVFYDNDFSVLDDP